MAMYNKIHCFSFLSGNASKFWLQNDHVTMHMIWKDALFYIYSSMWYVSTTSLTYYIYLHMTTACHEYLAFCKMRNNELSLVHN